MNIKCKILLYDEIQQSVVVRYYSDLVSEDDIAISLDSDGNIIRRSDGSPERCITDGNINLDLMKFEDSSIEEIKKYLLNHAPIHMLKNKHIEKESKIDLIKLKNEILQLIDKEIQSEVIEFDNNNIEEYIKKIIKEL